jgi:ribonuclease VapC
MVDFAVDASVLVAILKEEPEARRFEAALASGNWIIGWPAMLEVRIWQLRNPQFVGLQFVSTLVNDETVKFVDFSRDLEAIAAEAYARFGKGRHPATLNYGDCMTYAVAKHFDVPLLFKGADFGKTDLKIHPASAIIT